MNAVDFSPVASSKPLKVAIIFDDDVAGRRATKLLTILHAAEGQSGLLRPVPWCTAALMDLAARDRASSDIVDSDFIILSLNRPESLTEIVSRWLPNCLGPQRGRAVTLLVQFASDEPWTVSLEASTTSAPARPAFARSPEGSFPAQRPSLRAPSLSTFKSPRTPVSQWPTSW